MNARVLPVSMVAVVATVLALLLITTDRERGMDGGAARAGDGSARDPLVGAPGGSSARAGPPAAASEHPPELPEPLSELDLIAALRALGALDGLTDPRVPDRLRALLSTPSNASRTVELLTTRRLSGQPWTPQVHGGAVLLVTVAAAVYSAPADGELARLGLEVDGRAFVLTLLQQLHRFAPAVRERLVGSVRTVRIDGRLVLDVTYLDDILSLRAAHPEARMTYGELLLLIAEDLGPGERAALHTLFLSETDDPTLMKVALSNLLASPDGAHYVQLARILLDEGKLTNGVRSALLQAVASSAPVADAARIIAEHASILQSAQATTLGLRTGGVDALSAEYTRLVASNSDPKARRMLVAGMTFSDADMLRGIAQTDPDPDVRGQALSGLSANRNSVPADALELLETGWRERGDPLVGVSATFATTAASNLAGKLIGAERERALAVLREVAREGSSSSARAMRALRRNLSADEYAALEAELADR